MKNFKVSKKKFQQVLDGAEPIDIFKDVRDELITIELLCNQCVHGEQRWHSEPCRECENGEYFIRKEKLDEN